MPGIDDVIRRHQRIGIDTSIFIYNLEDSPTYADIADEVLAIIEHGLAGGVTSVVTLMELTVKPIQLGRPDLAERYEESVKGFPNMVVMEITAPVARRAAELRAAHRLFPADAMQIAACLHEGATAFVTNDARLRRVGELEIVILDDFV